MEKKKIRLMGVIGVAIVVIIVILLLHIRGGGMVDHANQNQPPQTENQNQTTENQTDQNSGTQENQGLPEETERIRKETATQFAGMYRTTFEEFYLQYDWIEITGTVEEKQIGYGYTPEYGHNTPIISLKLGPSNSDGVRVFCYNKADPGKALFQRIQRGENITVRIKGSRLSFGGTNETLKLTYIENWELVE